MFPDFGQPIRRSTNELVDYLVINFGDVFEAIANSLLVVLVGLEHLLRAAPP